jgi:hypothetical protein
MPLKSLPRYEAKKTSFVYSRLPTLEYFRSSRFQKDIVGNWKSKTYWEISLGSGKA